MKRALIITAGVIVLIGIIFVLYLWLRPTSKLTASSGNDFGDTGSGTVQSENTTEPGTGSARAGTVVAPSLIEITPGPVSAGEIAFDTTPPPLPATTTVSTSTSIDSAPVSTSPSTGDVEVRYIDRESGNVYGYLAFARTLTRLSDKTLPGIQEASWLPDGSMALVRFISPADGASQISTYALPFDGNGGYFLEQNLDQATIMGSSTIFTLTSGTDNSIGSTARSDGTNVQTVFSTPLTSIVAHAAGASLIAVTKATSELDGYAFTLSNGRFTPLLGPLRGLTVLPSPSGKEILYSYTDGSAYHMAVLDLTTGNVTSLPLATPTEKCVWTSDNSAIYCGIPTSFTGNLPDDWYQGTVSFTDRIWRLDLSSRLATLVIDPTQSGNVSIDAVNLTLDPNSQVLVFRNKKDGSLWAYSL